MTNNLITASEQPNATAPPVIIAFRKNYHEYIDDARKSYMDRLRDTGVCTFIMLDTLRELPQALIRKPQCLLFYADGLFEQHTSINEFVMMLKSMIHFTDPDLNIKIGFVMDTQTPYSFAKELQKAGIVGVVPASKSFGETETTKALEALINGIPYWPKHLIEQLPGNTPKPKREAVHLTHRQQEVLELIANRGLSNKQIARVLGISESTVKIHVSAIMKAYCVRNRTQLALTKK
jgi:DNA-binding CsgD family transcriptional regulator